MASGIENTAPKPAFEILHKIDRVSDIFKAPRLAPEAYPGEHPENPCALLDGNNLYGLRWNTQSTYFLNKGDFEPVLDTDQGPLLLDDYLRAKNVPPLAERYALTAFGSNRSPGQLLDKFRRKDTSDTDETIQEALEVVPMFMGTMKGYDAVYNAKPGNMGYFFADLYQGQETAETEIEVAVLFLTKDQLEIIHKSEKAYEFKLLGGVELGRTLIDVDQGASFKVPAFAHVGKTTAYAEWPESRKPRPIALSEVYAAKRGLTELSQTDFQERVFSNDPTGEKQQAFTQITGDPNTRANSANYLANMKMERAGGTQKLSQRKKFQELLIEAMLAEEKMVIDPDAFETTAVDFGAHRLPRLGEISVLNFIVSAAKAKK